MIALLLALGLALQVNPELKQHVEAGLAAKQAGDLDTAIREFQRVTELAPGLAAQQAAQAKMATRKPNEKLLGERLL